MEGFIEDIVGAPGYDTSRRTKRRLTTEIAEQIDQYLEQNRQKTTLLPAENTVPMLYYIDPKGALSKMTIAKKKFVKNEAWQDVII